MSRKIREQCPVSPYWVRATTPFQTPPHLLTHSEIVHSCIRLYSNWFEFDHSAFGSHWRRSCWWVRQIKSPQLAFGRITDNWLLTAFCDVVQDTKAGRDSSLVQSTHVVYNRAVVHRPIAVKHLVINNAYPKSRTYAQARIVLRRSLKQIRLCISAVQTVILFAIICRPTHSSHCTSTCIQQQSPEISNLLHQQQQHCLPIDATGC